MGIRFDDPGSEKAGYLVGVADRLEELVE